MAKLTKEEKEVLRSVESDEWRSVSGKSRDLEKYREYARATFKKDRRVNIRISTNDLKAIQKRALMEGVPYQTLISSILHKYLSGRLKEEGL